MPLWLTTSFWPRLRRAVDKWNADSISVYAAATSYYVALSFFPILLVAIATLGIILRFSASAQDAQQQLLDLIAKEVSEGLAGQVGSLLGQVRTGAGFSGTVGLITLFVNVTWILFQIQSGFDRVWGERNTAHQGNVAWLLDVIRGRAKAYLLLASLGLALIASFISGILLEAISRFASELPTGRLISNYTNPIISVLVNTPIFASIYKLQPRSNVKWRDVWMGAFLASATWEVGRQVLAMFVISDRYNTYGVVGSFIALMAWVYYASNVFFFGAEFVRVTQLTREEREATVPLPGASRSVVVAPKDSDLPPEPEKQT